MNKKIVEAPNFAKMRTCQHDKVKAFNNGKPDRIGNVWYDCMECGEILVVPKEKS